MIGTSTFDYVHIRFWIFFLRAITPVSICYCLLLLTSSLVPPLRSYRAPRIVEAWLIAETAFYFLFFLPCSYYSQRPAIHPERMTRDERDKLFTRCLKNVGDPERYLRQWFLGADPQEIKRDNVQDFLLWAFFNTDQMEEEYEEEMEQYMYALEELLGRNIPPGRGNAKCLRLTLDKVHFLHRSLLWYWGFCFYRNPLSRFFTTFPFRPLTLLTTHKSPVKCLTYWYRPHTSKEKLPILFIHGIGVGLYPYANFLGELATREDVGIIALEIMPISSRLTYSALEKDAMLREINIITDRHGWNRFVLVSHSYGSVISTHLLKSELTRSLVGPVVLIDPVSFLLYEPDIAYNFTARQPTQANEFQLWYFASTDIGVAHTLGRRFFWSENIVWKEDLKTEGTKDRLVTISMGAKDLIVDTKSVRRYLTSSDGSEAEVHVENDSPKNGTLGNGSLGTCNLEEEVPATGKSWIDILWFEDLDHAQVFDAKKLRKLLVEKISSYSEEG